MADVRPGSVGVVVGLSTIGVNALGVVARECMSVRRMPVLMVKGVPP